MIRKDKNSTGQAAKAILKVVPLVMGTVRAEMRAAPSRHAVRLSVPQFRTLNFIERHPEASLSDVAAHIGVTLPSMSRMVEGLVDRKLLLRRGHAKDRRRLTLWLNGRGRALLRAAHGFAEASIFSRLSALDGKDLADVVRAMDILRPLFTGSARPGNK